MLSKKEFQILSAKTGFLAHYLEKVYRLLSVLEEIARNRLLSDQIALKGGTAINHFFFDYPRLSIDLDFDYLLPVSREELDGAMNSAEDALKRIFRFLRYEVSDNKLAGHRQYYLKYRTQFESDDTIKVEVNYLLRQHLDDPITKEPQSPFGLSFKTKVLSMEEVYAAKCAALLDRGTPRDLFDIYYLRAHKNRSFDDVKFRRLFLFYTCLSRRTFEGFDASLDIVEAITEKEIKNHLWMLLRKDDRVPRAKMLKVAVPFLKGALSLSAREKNFFDLFGKGKPDFSLLFDDKDLAARLAVHPMVLWRLQNRK